MRDNKGREPASQSEFLEKGTWDAKKKTEESLACKLEKHH